ncbi:MAG: class I SAM-dependent methyltransferase [Actinobacteria bacterium]|nr:class I SAM-dependent methyltransferase [Actinomycetota bacterium]
MSFNPDWEREAANWIAWARTPNHDAYWEYSPGFFEFLPRPGSATLEIGCGEGRVARDLAARGHRVTAVDASPTLLAAAQELQPEAEFRLADAASLPFPGAAFDLVVAHNSLMDIEDMPGTVSEAARVLTHDGRFCISIVHPLADAGRFESEEPDARFVFKWPYFGPRRVEEEFERAGMRITFHGWAHSLEQYSRAFEDAGLVSEAIREPPHSDDGRWARLPLFLFLRLVKRPE